jgi:PAS domain S-box-containing protein
MMHAADPQPPHRGLVDAQLSLALAAGQMGTWDWDLLTNQVVWSPMVERIFGLDPATGGFGGTFDHFLRDVHPDDRAGVLAAVSLTMSGGPDYYIECRIVRPDRSIRWIEGRGRLLRDGQGKPERLIGVCSDITENKEANLRLQLSEAFYAATIMSVADAVVTTDPAGRVTLMNGPAELLTGWRLDEVRGRRFDEVVQRVADVAPVSDRPSPRPNVDVARSDLTLARRSAKLLLRRNGAQLNIDESTAPIRDTCGEVVGQVVVFRDVTEERQEQARRWFIAEASTLLTSSLDFEKTLTTIAELAVPQIADWCAIHAVAEDGSLQRLVVTHEKPEKAEHVARLLQYSSPGESSSSEVVRTGKSIFVPEVSDERLRAASDSDEHLEMLRGLGLHSYAVVPLRAGERILGAITFVTAGGARLDRRDLHMAEELGRRAGTAIENARLYREAHRARRTAENSAARASLIQEVTAALSEAPTPSIVAQVVTSLGTKAIGAAAATVYEVAKSGEELTLVRSMGYANDLLEGYRRISMTANLPVVDAIKTGRPIFYRHRRDLDIPYPGLVRPVPTFASWVALPLEVEGRRLGVLGVSFKTARDFDETECDFMITMSRLCAQALERAHLYDAAQTARAEAESSRRTRENLLVVVSHDLRNPLSAIATTASLLIKADPARETPARLLRYGNNILRAAQRMDRLIIDLLDLAKIEAGRLLIDPQEHDVASLVRDTVEMLAPVASSKGLSLTADVAKFDARIFCDRERVLQVLSNLIGNALKFTAQGGTIHVSACEIDGETRFAVTDTGCGIEADQLPHIFDRYWQAKGTRDGVGLGLSIAKGIVEAHCGKIWVETEMEQGTTFFFTLPKDPPDGERQRDSGSIKL